MKNQEIFYLFSFVFLSCLQVAKADMFQVVSAHGCMMVIAWVIFASNGILLMRYYSHLGRQIYFIHITFSILVLILSIASFLVIIGYYLNWNWVSTSTKTAIAHSAFGIVAIGFSVLQIITGLLHIESKFQSNKVVRYLHRFSGLIAFVLANVAILLATFFKFLNMTWIISVSWVLWLIIVVLILEAIYYFNSKYNLIKNLMLGFHVSGSLAASGLLCYFIITYAMQNITGYASDFNNNLF